MRVMLNGGPANGRIVELPKGLTYYRVPVYKEITIQERFATDIAEVNFDIADYRFTGYATVDLNGDMGVIIYEFEGIK